MKSIKILALPVVQEYLSELVHILYEKEYFGFEEDAQRYVEELGADIRRNLPTKLKKPAPPYFDKYGKHMRYATFRKNKNTQWYVFFSTYCKEGETIYLIRYIGNNHVLAQYL